MKNKKGIPGNVKKGLQVISAHFWPQHGVMGLQLGHLFPAAFRDHSWGTGRRASTLDTFSYSQALSTASIEVFGHVLSKSVTAQETLFTSKNATNQ